MIGRSIGPFAIVLLIAVLAGFYSFTTTYMACSARFDAVARAQTHLDTMCTDLAQMTVQLGALAYKNLTSVRQQIVTLEASKKRLEESTSVADRADACDALCATVSNLVSALNATSAADESEYTDLRAKIGTTIHQVGIAKTAHSKAVANYNTLLKTPAAAAWRYVMGFAPAELFVSPPKPVKTVIPAVLPVQDVPPATPIATQAPTAPSTPKPLPVPPPVRAAASTPKPSPVPPRVRAAASTPKPLPVPRSPRTSVSTPTTPPPPATNTAPVLNPFYI